MTDEPEVIFADLSFKNPEVDLIRVRLAACIRQVIEARGLAQDEVARIVGSHRTVVSRVINGHVDSRFTMDRLTRWLIRLGQDVRIKIEVWPK